MFHIDEYMINDIYMCENDGGGEGIYKKSYISAYEREYISEYIYIELI
jgi:hypothetical protein